jgi:hypothetical protein
VKVFLRIAAAAMLVAGGAGCALFGPHEPQVPEASLPSWIGRVVMVDTVHRFALVDTGGSAAPGPGTTVVTIREKRRTAVLRATAEARAPYVAMEIVVGSPGVGDEAALDESREEAPAPPAES